MPLIAMNREIGSLGKDVAQGVAEALGVKVQHHEMIDTLANRTRIRKSHVISFLEGKQGLIERLTTDQLSLRLLAADEILSLAEAEGGIVLRGWGATSLLKEVPHAVRVCISASRALRVRRMMERLGSNDEREVERIVDQNDEASGVVMRRHFHIGSRDIDEYDMCLNTDRLSVAECVNEVVGLAKSPRFAETEASRARLRDTAVVYRVRAALRTEASTSHCKLQVTADNGRVTLEGIVDSVAQSEACTAVASRLKGVASIDNRLRSGEAMSARLRGG
jgi:cytidylate kinase